MQPVSYLLPDEAATMVFGQCIAHAVAQSCLPSIRLHVNLIGDLGAGKTTLVRGVLRGLGYAGRVKSPTYPLLETYEVGAWRLAHFDLYRLETPEAFSEAGFDEYFTGPGIRFVEWPDRAGALLPQADWRLSLVEEVAGGRLVKVEALSATGESLLEQLSV